MLQVAILLLLLFPQSLQVFAKYVCRCCETCCCLRGEDFEECHQILNMLTL